MKRLILIAVFLATLGLLSQPSKPASAALCSYGQSCEFGVYMFNSNLSGSYYAINVYGDNSYSGYAYEQLEWYCPPQYISCYGYGGTYSAPYIQWTFYTNAFGTGYVNSQYCFGGSGYYYSALTNNEDGIIHMDSMTHAEKKAQMIADAKVKAEEYAHAHGGIAGPAVLK